MKKGENKKVATVRSLERRAQAMELRLAGVGYDDIGKALGITCAAAWRHVQDELERRATQLAENTDKVLALEITRLDQMAVALRPRVKAGDPEAIKTMLKVQERRSRYLGLDAPTKIAATTPDGREAQPVVIRVVYGPRKGGPEKGTEETE